MNSKDTRTLHEKMRDVASGRGAAPQERAFATQWLKDHPEPRAKATATPWPRGASRPTSDAEKRRRDEREEAAYRRNRTTDPLNVDAFEREMSDAFWEGFNQEMGTSFRAGARVYEATPETERIRREERELRESMRESRARARAQQEKEQAAYKAAMKEMKDKEREKRKAAKASGQPPRPGLDYFIEFDEAGNPIRRRAI